MNVSWAIHGEEGSVTSRQKNEWNAGKLYCQAPRLSSRTNLILCQGNKAVTWFPHTPAIGSYL